jgi:hypothetical protein
MKIKLQQVFFVFALAMLSPAAVYWANAQEANNTLQDSFDDLDNDRGRVISSTGDGEAALSSKGIGATVRDSVSIRSTTPNTRASSGMGAETPRNASKPPAQGDDSVLSFNFLYYLIEKYKLQDIVD